MFSLEVSGSGSRDRGKAVYITACRVHGLYWSRDQRGSKEIIYRNPAFAL